MKLNNFRKKLICWGAGDQAIVLKPIIEDLGAQYTILVDDTPNKQSPFEGVDLLGGKDTFEKWFSGRNPSDYGFIIAIGNPFGFVRCDLHDYLISKGLQAVNICAPSALVDKNVEISDGVQIMKGAIVNAHSKLGKQVILNTRSVTEHHDILSDGVEIGPGATLCGRVLVHKFGWVCAGATVLPRIEIGENSIVGAGSLIRENVPQNSVFAGVPGKFIKINESKFKNDN